MSSKVKNKAFIPQITLLCPIIIAQGDRLNLNEYFPTQNVLMNIPVDASSIIWYCHLVKMFCQLT